MLPKSYIFWKWTVYSLATLLLSALQYLVLNQIRVFDIYPFLYPMLPAVLSSYEGYRRGTIFSLCLGVACDLLLVGPFEGFFTLVFTMIGLLSGLIAENLLSPGYLCSLTVSSMALLLTGFFRMAVQMLTGGGHLLLMIRITVVESLLSLPALFVIVPLYQFICQRCANDY